jgi:hypothetical protein
VESRRGCEEREKERRKIPFSVNDGVAAAGCGLLALKGIRGKSSRGFLARRQKLALFPTHQVRFFT